MLMKLLKNRRSVRIFNGKKISQEEILSIIEAGIWAPTGCNNQELKFLIIDEKKDLGEVLKFKSFFRGVSHVVLIFCDMSLPMSKKMYVKNKGERHLPDLDTGLAMQNMILFAKNKGIDSCIFNLSKYHSKESSDGHINKILNKVKAKLNLHSVRKNSFEYYLRTELNLPKYLKIQCGIAFGYAKKYPDVNIAKHGWNKIMRNDISYYLIRKKKV